MARQVHWWEPMLPAGMWLLAANRTLGLARQLRRLGFRSRRGTFAILRMSSRLSRAGFNAWHFWGGKWR